MTTIFDDISNEFSSTVNQTKEFIRIPLFLELVGDIQNKNVIDFGCGDGFFTRILAENFPKEVIGVDYSKELIKKAIEKEQKNPQNISYFIDDVRSLELNKKFDLASAVYLLDYAQSKEDLFKMIKNIFNHLDLKGKFCAIVPHPNIQPIKQFEFERRITSLNNKTKLEDGDKLKCEIKKDNKQFEFTFYYWSRETYNKILNEIGFKNINWVEPFVSGKGIELFGNEYWKRFLRQPSSIGFICYK